jgi:hypothetical protein
MKLIKIKLLCDSRGCKIKYNRCLFVNAFIKRLKTGNTWVNLQNEFKISKTHLHRIFTSWSDNNVFENVYNTFLKNNKCYIDNDEVYIDSSIIINKYGYKNTTGINTYEARKHRSNKISCIVSKNGFPLGIKVTNSQIHDIKILYDTLPKKTFFTKLIGDKGYISENIKKKLQRNRKINLITNYRKNQKKKQNINISSRITIEHFNCLIKQNKIINIRYDKSIESYENMVYLGCLYRSLQIVFNILYIQ